VKRVIKCKTDLKEFVVQFYRPGSDRKVVTIVEAIDCDEARDIIESEGCKVVSVKES